MDFPYTTETGTVFTGVSDPVWADAGHTIINCTLSTEQFGDIPFTATTYDSMVYGPLLFDMLKDTAADYVRPDVTIEDLQEQFDKIWPDVVLGLADQATIDLATNLRRQIKVMQE
ncbi:putative tail fiber assembly protein [Pseudomonas phage Eisa9]|uniref:Tail fiber assembly protein n=1 Tax=Pseudomonas phage Eisa9 TaxID=2900148 RepID=A0AAE9C943_9CAUD|nr:putative tail fiber assembly protein [Pseudomonas phage Eisa9]